MNNAISSPECPWPPGTLAGVKAPPPSHQHLLLSTPPLPSTPTQPCQAAGGRGFTTRGPLFSNSGTHCRAACAGDGWGRDQYNRYGSEGGSKGGRLQGGSASSEASPHNKGKATLAKLHLNVRRRQEV